MICVYVHMCLQTCVLEGTRLKRLEPKDEEYGALHVNVTAMTHTHISRHTQPQSFYISISTKRAAFPFSVMLSSPPAALFNKSLSARPSSARARMCVCARAARGVEASGSPLHAQAISGLGSLTVFQTVSSSSCLSFAHSYCPQSSALALRRQSLTPNIGVICVDTQGNLKTRI